MTEGQIVLLGIVLTAVTGLVSTLVTLLISRRGQDAEAARAAAEAQRAAAALAATGSDNLRDDLMQWIGILRKEVSDLRAEVETVRAQAVDDSLRHRAHVAHLEAFAIHAPEPPPRVVPPFRWPPPPDATTTPGGI